MVQLPPLPNPAGGIGDAINGLGDTVNGIAEQVTALPGRLQAGLNGLFVPPAPTAATNVVNPFEPLAARYASLLPYTAAAAVVAVAIGVLEHVNGRWAALLGVATFASIVFATERGGNGAVTQFATLLQQITNNIPQVAPTAGATPVPNDFTGQINGRRNAS